MYDRIDYNKKLTPRSRDLRNHSTLCEVLLWNKLKAGILGKQFYRQFVIYHYIVDFYCKDLKLAIEIDGKIHVKQEAEDSFRQGELETLGVIFLRFSNSEILYEMSRVIDMIKITISKIEG